MLDRSRDVVSWRKSGTYPRALASEKAIRFFSGYYFYSDTRREPRRALPSTSHHDDVLEQAVSRWHHLRPDKSPKHPLHWNQSRSWLGIGMWVEVCIPLVKLEYLGMATSRNTEQVDTSFGVPYWCRILGCKVSELRKGHQRTPKDDNFEDL